MGLCKPNVRYGVLYDAWREGVKMQFLKMNEVDLKGKRVLIREDLNVPIKDGLITSDQRLQAAIPTLQQALNSGAGVMVMSHLGRPEEGVFDPTYSLEPVADYFRTQINTPVHFVRDYLDGVAVMPGELVILENVRFNVGEKANDETLSKKMAALCDIFVMDAFGTAHRAHASTCGVTKYAPLAVAGPLLVNELETINRIFLAPVPPIVAVVGGAKISSKLTLLKRMVELVDYLIPGGGIANTFLKAKGFEVGNSLCENALIDEAKAIFEHAALSGCKILLPNEVIVGKTFSVTCPAYNKTLGHLAQDDMILDIGPSSIADYTAVLDKAGTIIWNGPVGVFELPQFTYGTRSLAIAIANSKAFTIAGGGDTLAAIDQYGLNSQIDYVSTGGSAFLECLEGKRLPAVEALKEVARRTHPI